MISLNNSAKALAQASLAKTFRARGIRLSVRRLVQANYLPEAVWRRLPIEGSFEITFEDSLRFTMACSSNNHLVRALYWFGGEWKEPATVPVFRALAQRSSMIVDVGASQGFYTLVGGAQSPKTRIVAYEPNPSDLEMLDRNIKLNEFGSRCRVVEAAVGADDGPAQFCIPASGHGYLSETDLDLDAGAVTHVDVVSLDGEFDDRSSVDLVKIDVEGGEMGVLKGMTRILTTARPHVILEVLPESPNEQISRLLRQLGYQFWHLSGEGPTHRKSLVPDSARIYRNYLCVHGAKVSEVLDLL